MTNVVAMELTEPLALNMIAKVLDSGSQFVVFTDHALERMKVRNINRVQVIKCLRHGHMTEGPYKTPKGNWRFNMATLSCGEPVTVGAALDNQNSNNIIVVITTI